MLEQNGHPVYSYVIKFEVSHNLHQPRYTVLSLEASISTHVLMPPSIALTVISTINA
jgi:hypothetical protein